MTSDQTVTDPRRVAQFMIIEACRDLPKGRG